MCNSTNLNYLSTNKITLMELKTFGTKPKAIYTNLIAFSQIAFTGYLNVVNGASIQETIKNFSDSLNTGILRLNTIP